MTSTVYTYSLTGLSVFPVNFEYLARRFVVVTLIGTAGRRVLSLTADYKFTSKTEITTSVVWGPSQGYSTMEIRRFTSATDKLVNFTDGSILRSYDLNISQVQAIHIAEEGRDTAGRSILNNGTSWDALGMPIKNVGTPSDPTDAATAQFVTDRVTGVQAYVDSIIKSTLRGGPLEALIELPSAASRANRMLSFNAQGQPMASIPQSGEIGDFAFSLANSLDEALGAAMWGYKGRSGFERLSEQVYFKDHPFNGKADGVTDDSAAIIRFAAYCAVNGVKGNFGKGTIYLKDARIRHWLTEGTFKSFILSGEGPGITHIKFGNVSPEFNAAGVRTKNEPNLFDFRGSAGLVMHPRVRLENFSFDYEEQVFKGGASRDTPALTDIKPISNGVTCFMSEYGDGIEVVNVVGTEVYGNGVISSRSPNSLVDNVRMYNVSGGNPGLVDSSGGFIGLMRGSQVGSLVTHCIGLNTRKYQTHTIGGFNTTDSFGTLCGYIGIWTEYGTRVDNVLSPGADQWANVEPTNRVSFGCRIENSMVAGYTLGIKSEGHTPTTVDSCISVNCWIPYIGAATQGRVVNSFADCGDVDGIKCPQSGYEYVRALFVHYNVSATASSFPGFTYDGCLGFTRRTRINTVNCGDGRFLNQQVVISHAGTGGDVSLLSTRMLKGAHGVKVSGIYIIRELGEDKIASIFDVENLDLNITILNLTDKLYTVNPQAYVKGNGCGFSKIHIDSRGLVKLQVRTSPEVDIDFKTNMTDEALAWPSYIMEVDRVSLGSKIRFCGVLHSASIPGSIFAPVNLEADYSDYDGYMHIVPAAAGNTFQSILLNNARQAKLSLIKRGDINSVPLVKLGTSALGVHIERANPNDACALFDIGYGIIGPISFNEALMGCRAMTQQTLYYEPNHPDRLAKDSIEFAPGVTYQYIRSVPGGAAGCRVHKGGQRSAAWAATTAVTVNTQRASGLNVYRATTGGVTGSAPPTHTSGTATDGTVVWTWVAPFAQFYELANTSPTLI